jgi:hypothetical protein
VRMKSLQSFIILVEDVINIIRDALDLEVGRLAVPQEVGLALLAPPSLIITQVVASTGLSGVAVSGGGHPLLSGWRIGILCPILIGVVVSFEFCPALIIEVSNLVLIIGNFLGHSIKLGELILKLLDSRVFLFVVDVVLVDLESDALKLLVELEIFGLVDLAVDFVHFLLQHLLHGAQFLGAGLIEELFFLHLLQIGSQVGVSRTVLFGLGTEGELEVEVLSLGGLHG